MNYLLDKIHVILSLYGNSVPAECFPLKVIFELENEGYTVKEEYRSERMMNYRYNYLITKVGADEGVIFVGFRLNTYKEQSLGLRFVGIEYNPQKIRFPRALRNFFCTYGYKYSSIKDCDVAIDFLGRKMSDFRVITKKNIMLVGTCSNLTKYISPSSSHLRIKIYDKTIERSMRKITIPQTCRVEISLKKPVFHQHFIMDKYDEEYIKDIRAAISEISLPASMPLLIDNLIEKYGDYDECLCYLLSSVDEETRQRAFSLMGKGKKSKYRAYFTQGQYLPIDIDIYGFHTMVSRQINDVVVDCCARCDYID